MTTDEQEITNLDKIKAIDEKIDLYNRIVILTQEGRDVFIELNGIDISNPEEYDQFMQDIESKKQILLQEKVSLENQG
jgi:hypothetical protein